MKIKYTLLIIGLVLNLDCWASTSPVPLVPSSLPSSERQLAVEALTRGMCHSRMALPVSPRTSRSASPSRKTPSSIGALRTSVVDAGAGSQIAPALHDLETLHPVTYATLFDDSPAEPVSPRTSARRMAEIVRSGTSEAVYSPVRGSGGAGYGLDTQSAYFVGHDGEGLADLFGAPAGQLMKVYDITKSAAGTVSVCDQSVQTEQVAGWFGIKHDGLDPSQTGIMIRDFSRTCDTDYTSASPVFTAGKAHSSKILPFMGGVAVGAAIRSSVFSGVLSRVTDKLSGKLS